ncbi:MAG: tetratricopeptide repeat protein [Marinobacter sp.]
MVPDVLRSVLLMFWLFVFVAGCASTPEPQPAETDSAGAGELVRQAWHAQQQGNTGQALDQYRQAFSLDPRNAMTANNLALLLREEGRFAEAISILRKGLEHSPDTEELHYNLAVISELYLLDLDTALRHYRRYQDLSEAEGKQVAGWIADLERRVE